MNQSSDIILNHKQIVNKLTRLAWQVYENNMDEKVLWIVGIDKRGMYIANRIASELSKISDQKIQTMNAIPGESFNETVYESEFDLSSLQNSVVILVDDVLNTGKTLVSAMLPLFSKNVSKMQVVVLASRSHRLFPVKADFVGISMATTLQEHLNFDNSDENNLTLKLT